MDKSLLRHLRWLVVLGAVFSLPAVHAEGSWVVQVGAYSESPGAAELSVLQDHGPLQTTTNVNGLNIVSLGPFADRADAQAAMLKVQSIVPDAYIRRAVAGTSSASVASVASVASIATTPGVTPVAVANAGTDAVALLNQLPVDERRNVVMLDGRLHYKDGEQFTPLAEYLRGR